MCEWTWGPSPSSPIHPSTYPTSSSRWKAPYGMFPLSANARIISRGTSWCSPHVATMTWRILSASSRVVRSRSSTPAALAASSASVRAALTAMARASLSRADQELDRRRGPCRGTGPCPTSDPGTLTALRRRELLPFVLAEVLSSATLEERHDGSHDRGDERNAEKLSEEPTLLLLVRSGVLTHQGYSPFTVGLVGLEPTTSSLSGMRSNQSELQAPKEPPHDLHPGPGQAYAS